MNAEQWENVFDQMWAQLDELPPRKRPPTAQQWARQFGINQHTFINAIVRRAKPLFLTWRARKRFWTEQLAEDIRTQPVKSMAALAERYHIPTSTMRGTVEQLRKRGTVDASTHRYPSVDWDAVAREVNDYLDKLEPNERPMAYGSWATVLDIGWNRLADRAKRYPEQSWARALARHKAIDAKWRADLLEAVERHKGRRGYLTAIARDFHITYAQADALVAASRARGQLPKANRPRMTAERIVSAAKVGMTRRELAAAAGISLHCLEQYLRPVTTNAVNVELRARLAWNAGEGKKPSTIKAIRKNA